MQTNLIGKAVKITNTNQDGWIVAVWIDTMGNLCCAVATTEHSICEIAAENLFVKNPC